MSKKLDNKVIVGALAGVLVVAGVLWVTVFSGTSTVPAASAPGQARVVSTTDDLSADPVTRSAPKQSSGGGRLEASAEQLTEEAAAAEDQLKAKSKKKKVVKKRGRRKRSTQEEEPEAAAAKKTTKKIYGK